jgi:hypothetical protein
MAGVLPKEILMYIGLASRSLGGLLQSAIETVVNHHQLLVDNCFHCCMRSPRHGSGEWVLLYAIYIGSCLHVYLVTVACLIGP